MKLPPGQYSFWWLMTTGLAKCPSLSSFRLASGYVVIKATKKPAVQGLEHRIVMEEWLFRKLNHNEDVHHINEIRDDNRLENLRLCSSRKEHFSFHPCTSEKRANISIGQLKRFGGVKQSREERYRIARQYYREHKAAMPTGNGLPHSARKNISP